MLPHHIRLTRTGRKCEGIFFLRRLELNDDGMLPSLKPLESLRELQEVLFYESTNILDGDLSPLTQLPHLKKVSFRNRRHYSHRREQLVSRAPND